MANQIALMEVFRDTQIQIKENEKLRKETRKIQAGSVLYLDQFYAMNAEPKYEKPNISVVADTTFHCAKSLIEEGKKTAVLNFANAYNPGGGVKNGAPAQEEALCRCSNLYEALTVPYMIRHYYKWNQKNTGDMGSDRIIYSPDITVFKSDDEIPEMLAEWFRVDVISCAAPYYDSQKKKPVSKEKLEEVFMNRIRNILEVAIANEVDYFILGAFGCGVFHCNPEIISKAFIEFLKENRSKMKDTVFAIPDENSINFKVFVKNFSQVF